MMNYKCSLVKGKDLRQLIINNIGFSVKESHEYIDELMKKNRFEKGRLMKII